MRRNLELMRLILLKNEASTASKEDVYKRELVMDEMRSFSNEERVYNTYLLIDGGYLHGKCVFDDNYEIKQCDVGPITWKGQELLSSFRTKTQLQQMIISNNAGMRVESFLST